MMVKFITILLLAFAQNVSFTIVSRSRNRSSYRYHMITSVFSNGIWFLTFRQLVLGEMNLLLFVPYTLGTVAGSLFGAKLSMMIEARIGALSDSHIKDRAYEDRIAVAAADSRGRVPSRVGD